MAQEAFKRKLTAIFSADAVEYSRLMAASGAVLYSLEVFFCSINCLNLKPGEGRRKER